MIKRFVIVATAWIVFGGVSTGLNPAVTVMTAPQSAPSAAQSPSSARAVFSKYCVSCHNDRLKTGGLALDLNGLDDVSRGAEIWEKVILKLRTGSMPPVGRPRPDRHTYDALASWLEHE